MKSYVSLCFTAIVLFLSAHEGSASVCEWETILGFTSYFNCPQPTDSEGDRFCCGSKKNRYCCDSPFDINDDLIKQVASKDLQALAQVQETPVVPKTANDQEGVRDTVDRIKVKVNGTVRAAGDKLNPKVGVQKAKDKVKQKIKDKVKEKAVKKLDPTGTIKSLPVIIGVIAAVILGILVLCIVCCCCCPFCLLHKRRNRGAVHNPATADVTVTQPLQPMPPMQQPYPGQQPYAPQVAYPQAYPLQQPPQQPYPPQGGYPPQQPYPQHSYPPQEYPPAHYPDLSEK